MSHVLPAFVAPASFPALHSLQMRLSERLRYSAASCDVIYPSIIHITPFDVIIAGFDDEFSG